MKQIWTKIDESIWECPYKFSAGLSRTVLLKIDEKKFLVYSPGDLMTAKLAKQIIPEASHLYLLAPNSYHNLGLSVWRDAFANTSIVATDTAKARLLKRAGIEAGSLDELIKDLPSNISLMELPYNKVGEVFLDIKSGTDRIWVVCDAVFNFSKIASGFMGFMMKLNRMGPGFEISRMYEYMGTSNKKQYAFWLLQEIKNRKPNRFIPLHGEIVRDADLSQKLESLVKSRLLKMNNSRC